MAVNHIRLKADDRKAGKRRPREEGKLLQVAIPVSLGLGIAEIALIFNEVKGDSLIDVLKNSHITALSQIIHVEMIQIFHVVSEGFLDAEILGEHNPHVKILLIKAFRQGAHYVRQTARLNKRNRF